MKNWVEKHFSDNRRAMTTITVFCWAMCGLAVAVAIAGLLFGR
jgi:hypothetical protein